jgi:hypothetical protein
MSYVNKIFLCGLILACCSSFVVIPALAFTANSLDITVDKNGDAVATFRFTLEGIIENTIPQSMLEEELKKGLTTSAEPPDLISMDRSTAVLRMRNFAATSDVPTGTGYLTVSMDFKLAEIALQNSALSSVVSADFSPETITLTFPDSYQQKFYNVDVLPAVFHTVIDPSKTPRATVEPATAATGSMNVTSSPLNVKVYLDSNYIGEAPSLFPGIGAGTHTVEFRKEGFESTSKDVTILEGKTTNVMVVLKYIPPVTPAETSSSSGLFWPVLIIALIAIAGGGYYFWSQKKKKEWEEEEETEEEPTGFQHPADNGKPPEETAVSGPDAGNTVVRVTMLRDIPEKEPGNTGRKDEQE